MMLRFPPKTSDWLVISPSGKPVRQRSLYKYTSIGPQLRFGCFNNSIANVSRGLVERVCMHREADGTLVDLYDPPRAFFDARMSRFRDSVVELLPVLPPVSAEMYISKYSGGKWKMYERERISLEREPIHEKDSCIGAFPKFENTKEEKLTAACRIISPRGPRFNIELGRRISQYEKPIARAIGTIYGKGTFKPVIMSGLNARERATNIKRAWDSRKNPVVIGLDAKHWDKHVSQTALRHEHSVYLGVSKGPDQVDLKMLLECQIYNKIRARCDDGFIKVTKLGGRMSGDVNTSLGNRYLMCALVWSWARDAGLVDYDFINDGDDGLLFIEKCDLQLVELLAPWFMQMGFRMQVEAPVYEFEQIEFCQTQPVLTTSGYRMVRNPRVAMSKDLSSTSNIRDLVTRRRWLNAVGACGTNLTQGVPVWEAFYSMFPRTGEVAYTGDIGHVKQSGLRWLSKNMKTSEDKITPAVRYSFWLAFGILPDEQIALEGLFRAQNLGDRRYVHVPLDYGEPLLPGHL